MNGIRNNYLSLSPGARRTLLITLLIGVFLSVFASQLFAELFSPITNFQTRVADSIPAILGLIAFISAGFTLSGRPATGVWLIFITAIVCLLVAPMLAEGYGFPAASVVLVIALFLPAQVLHVRQTSIVLLIGFAASVLIIVIDTFVAPSFSRIRIGPDDVRMANILTMLLIAIILSGLVFQYHRFSLRTKLIIAFLGLTAISVGLITVQNLTVNTRNQTATIGYQVNRAAENKALVFGSELSRLVNLLIVASNDASIQQAVTMVNQSYHADKEIRDQIDELSQQWQRAYPSNQNDPLIYDRLNNPAAENLRLLRSRVQSLGDLFITDQNGALTGTAKIIPQYDFSNETWWQKASNSGKDSVYIGLLQSNDESQAVDIMIAIPVLDRVNNNIIGILGTVFPFQSLREMLTADIDLLGENAGVGLIFQDDTPVILEESEIVEGDLVSEALQLAENQTYFQMNYKGQDSLVSVVNIHDIQNSEYINSLKWKVVVHNNTREALAPIQTQRRTSIAILLVIVILGTAGALGLAQLLSSPLQRLSEVAQKFGAGDLNIRAKVESEDEIGTLATAFNDMAGRIRQILTDLEKQVAERTKAVLTSAEVSRRLSTILDQRQLLLSVVEEIQSSFNFYHVQIYLFDDTRENLVMLGGTGEAGRIMMARGHKIERGKGLVGRAAETNTTILVPDTTTDPNWLPNPLLPDTKSEVAVPITAGEHVLGVLDIQHHTPQSLTDQTAGLLQSIAIQVAIAVQNARSFSEAQRQADREALILTINQKIQAETTMDKVLEIAARELGVALSVPKVTIQLESNPTKFTGNSK